jgi:hypothetical protein
MKKDEIDNIFTYHKPNSNQTTRYEKLREDAKELAYAINSMCPECREKSLALTNLQQTVMWANASIALHDSEDFGVPHPPPLDYTPNK